MFKLRCAVQTYDWGKVGSASEVFNLVKNWSKVPRLDENQSYAELWMGTHPSGPSLIGTTEVTLEEYIKRHSSILGPGIQKQFGSNLPFLFKVLSIRKALSIQAHPNKTHAEQLHKDYPDLYKDSNHKPELAVALTDFEALLAFRPIKEIAIFIKEIPELLQCIGNEAASGVSLAAEKPDDDSLVCEVIRTAYSSLMRQSGEKVAGFVEAMRIRLQRKSPLLQPSVAAAFPSLDSAQLSSLFLLLSTDFPGDVGCFSLFFLNYLKLKPGEAIFLEANLPHAYLSGDCIECMSCSDNVVRAGLTPKHKDVGCLLQMLLYSPRQPEQLRFEGILRSAPLTPPACIPGANRPSTYPEIVSFMPPVKDFAVDKIVVPALYTSFQLCPVASASILLVIEGRGRIQRMTPVDACNLDDKLTSDSETLEFGRGSIFFIASGVSVCFHQQLNDSKGADNQRLLAFRAYGNVDFLV